MSVMLRRIIGLLLVVAAVGGLLFSLYGLVTVWRLRPIALKNATSSLDLVQASLVTTSQGLTVARQSLNSAMASISALESAITVTSKTFEDTVPLFTTLTDLTSNELPKTVESAQTSLLAAQESAKIIDSVLRALVSIPFVNKDIYNPPVPLDQALGDVSKSMDGLPAALKTIGTSMEATSDNLEVMRADMDQMATDIRGINSSLEDAQGVVDAYQQLVDDLEGRMKDIRPKVPDWLDSLAWVVTLAFLWLGIAQIGLLLQGLQLLGFSLALKPVEVESED
jgi:methyl-accepting chemotaxis protein